MTLVLVKRSSTEVRWALEVCDNGCGDAMLGNRVAAFQAFILGHHCAWLCPQCARAWEATWTEAGGREPVRCRRRAGSVTRAREAVGA